MTGPVNLGIMPPYLGPEVADPGFVREFCLAVEAAGLESVWAVEHVVMPVEFAAKYPYSATGELPLTGNDPMPDPLEWLAFAAAVTSTIVLGTAIVILPEHNPVVLAKRLATLDVLSGGRVVFGVGVGWMREESEAVGIPFEERGARTDEHIDVLRALWRQDAATFNGRFTRFDAVRSLPRPVRPEGVPIMIGGHSPAAARRAGRRGDGFYPLGVTPDELSHLLGLMGEAAVGAGRDPAAIEITVAAPSTPELAGRFIDLGVSRFLLSARPGAGPEGVGTTLERFRDRVLG